jgi:hypothetical protein
MNLRHRGIREMLSVAFFALLLVAPFSRTFWAQSTKGSGGMACPAHWTAHICGPDILCVAPEVEAKYDLEAPLRHVHCSPKAAAGEIPASSLRDDPYLYGFSVGAGLQPTFRRQALMLDSSMLTDGDVEGALKALDVDAVGGNEWAHPANQGHVDGTSAMLASLRMPSVKVNQVGAFACPSPSLSHVCSSMILLCVAPQIEGKYDLPDSEVFQRAYCDATPLSKPVPATSITGDPYKAGYYIGFMVLPPKFVKLIKLDNSQMVEGNLDEALIKLDLRIPPDWVTKFDKGIHDGAEDLISAVDKAEEKAKQH